MRGRLVLGKSTVGNFLVRAHQAGLSWQPPTDLDDDSLKLLLFGSPKVIRIAQPTLTRQVQVPEDREAAARGGFSVRTVDDPAMARTIALLQPPEADRYIPAQLPDHIRTRAQEICPTLEAVT